MDPLCKINIRCGSAPNLWAFPTPEFVGYAPGHIPESLL